MLSVKTPLYDLSDNDLLECFMPKEVALQLIEEYGTIQNVIMHATEPELKEIHGMNNMRIRKLACLQELVKRIQYINAASIVKIQSPQDVFDHCVDMQYLCQEECRVLLLDTKNNIMQTRLISRGTMNASVVSTKDVFRVALKHMAYNIIFVHNHPSGLSDPSSDDEKLTINLIKSGVLLGISLIDHIIIGKGCYYSFKENQNCFH